MNTQTPDADLHKLFVGSIKDCELHWIDYCNSGRSDRLTVLAIDPDGSARLWADSIHRKNRQR